jgi:hypothetical protein
MQIASSTLQPLLPTQITPAGSSGTSAEETAERALRALPALPGAAEKAPATPANTEDDNVTLSAAKPGQRDYSAGIFAEIWKNGVKVAQVDNHGGVTSFIGPMAGSSGGGGGAMMASLRAAQIAQSIGGEIRVAGQVTDGATLSMRAKLREMYGT